MARHTPPPEIPAPQADPILPEVNPAIEPHATPSTGLAFPIVAIGASAGGLEATSELLRELPPDSGMAFVLIQHLSPNHASLLPEILGRHTSMPVTAVDEGIAVMPDHVYVIPPGQSMALSNGTLKLTPREQGAAHGRPVDHFMRSLAEEHGHKAIGVILSGTGSDGTLGMQELKAAGGITFAQDDTAEHTGMPRSAVAGGAVDYVLPAAEIARELNRLSRHPYVVPVDEDWQQVLQPAEVEQVLEVLRTASGVDFGFYKRNTLQRRITRRLVLHRMDSVREYLKMLQTQTGEVDSLYQDILINVTSFFRNPEAYEALKVHVFPKLLEERAHADAVRIWALGCSTGEEAYSLAITFNEYLEQADKRVPLQVFATDLNEVGIERARSGVYNKGITQDVSPERLRRYFVEDDGSYRINKSIRDMCVFSRQNALTDPPFSRIDLVACRNMLIYLEPPLQQRLIPMLHYALRAEGFLWLGGSETIGSYRDLFELLDARNKIYEKKGAGRNRLGVPTTATRWMPHANTAAPARQSAAPDPEREADRVVLARYAPPGVVLDGNLDIVQFRGDTSAYLKPAPGKASLNVLKMLRDGLLVPVRGAIARAKRDQLPAREEGLRVRSNGGWRTVDVVLLPLKAGPLAAGTLLMVFEEKAHSLEARAREADAEAKSAPPAAEGSAAGEVNRLKQELAATRDYLQSVVEQQEAANEELQSANEEVQSANEELQSINEELETSKEELQSSNEELATVNDELQDRNTELSRSNDDFVNLLGSAQMAIVMVGHDLRIRRFTPTAEKVLKLIAADVGRPLGDIQLNIQIKGLEEVAARVMDSMAVEEHEVQDRAGRWHLLRVQPYRTTEHRIDGAVIVMVEIDRVKRAEQALRESEARFELLADNAPVLIWMNDLEGCRFVNRAFEDFVGAAETQIRSADPTKYIHPDDRAEYMAAYQRAAEERSVFQARFRFRRADGAYRWMKSVGNPRFIPDGQFVGYVGCTFDITDMKDAESALVDLDRAKNEFLAMLAHELRNPLAGVRNATRLLLDTQDGEITRHAHEIIERQTANMVRMVDDLLDVSRITHGKIQLRPEPMDLAAAVKRVVEATEADRKASRQLVTLALPEGPVWINADTMRIDQVLANLLNNAGKFTPTGGRLWVTVERDLKPEDALATKALVRVRDNGAGIDPAILPRVFDLFVQADRFVDRSRTGIGLGLTLAKRLIDLHGGTIDAHSPGKGLGSEFVICLPLLSPDAIPKNGNTRKATKPRPVVSRRRILIVDDNRDSAESLRLMLRIAGHTVESVFEGGEALGAVIAQHPDVVLLDIGLPDIDGYEVARRLRATPAGRDVLIIAVSGYGRDEDVRRSHEAGIDEHLTKPLDPDKLAEVIARGRA